MANVERAGERADLPSVGVATNFRRDSELRTEANLVNANDNRNALRFVVLTVLIDAIGFGIVMPVLPGIVMRLGHVGLARATEIGGWLGMVYAGVQFLTGPLIGNLGDRFGRRPVLLGALGGFAIDYALLGFAPTLGWLFVGRALAGLFGASMGPAGAALADVSAPEDRARLFGMIGAAFGIGFIVGPAIGGMLGQFGDRAPFQAAAVLATCNFALGMFAFPETLPKSRRRAFEWRRANPVGALLALGKLPGLLPLSFASFWWMLAGMVYPTAWSWFTIAAFGWRPGVIGLSLAWVGALMTLSQMFLVGRIVRRLGERRAAELGILAATAGFIIEAVAPEGWMLFPALLFVCLQAAVMPAMSGLMSRLAPPTQQGELQGFNGSIQSIGSMLAPVLYNPALALFTSPSAPIHFPGVVFALATLAGWIAFATLLFSRSAPTKS
jgi:MFS transporter, DHA1 family, tetracycline resistance protein